MTCDDRLVVLGARKQRALLAVLLLRATGITVAGVREWRPEAERYTGLARAIAGRGSTGCSSAGNSSTTAHA